jgi:purine-binding chemotaxis protein CheW
MAQQSSIVQAKRSSIVLRFPWRSDRPSSIGNNKAKGEGSIEMKSDQESSTLEEGTIDWTEVHRRMDLARMALEHGATQSPGQIKSILKARARELSLEQETDISREFIEIVEFRLASEIYGIETAFVREVYPLKYYTALPGTPQFVLGIINVHGQILSVIDLKKFFNLPERGLGDLNKVIILRNDHMEFGILADAILGTRSIIEKEIQASPVAVTGIGADYLKGVAEGQIIVLDGDKILGDKKIIVNQEG